MQKMPRNPLKTTQISLISIWDTEKYTKIILFLYTSKKQSKNKTKKTSLYIITSKNNKILGNKFNKEVQDLLTEYAEQH